MTNEIIDAVVEALKFNPPTKDESKDSCQMAVDFTEQFLPEPHDREATAAFELVMAIYESLLTGESAVCAWCNDCGECAPRRVELQKPLAEEFRKRGILIAFGNQDYKGSRWMDSWSIELKAEMAQPAVVQ